MLRQRGAGRVWAPPGPSRRPGASAVPEGSCPVPAPLSRRRSIQEAAKCWSTAVLGTGGCVVCKLKMNEKALLQSAGVRPFLQTSPPPSPLPAACWLKKVGLETGRGSESEAGVPHTGAGLLRAHTALGEALVGPHPQHAGSSPSVPREDRAQPRPPAALRGCAAGGRSCLGCHMGALPSPTWPWWQTQRQPALSDPADSAPAG